MPNYLKAEEPAVPAVSAGPANTGTPGKRTPAERARLAALARWGKYKAKGKQKGKGRKPAQTLEAKEAVRRQEAQANRAKVMDSFGSFGRDTLPDLEALASGKEIANVDGMVMSGLAEKLENGTVVLTAEGKKLYNAASRGDAAAAKEAIARAESNAMARDEKAKAKADKEKGAKEEAEKPKGGGGGGGAAKPSDEEKEAERKEKADAKKQETRTKVRDQMAQNDAGLSPAGFDAFTGFADGGSLDKRTAQQLGDMGLVEGDPPRLTEAGRGLRQAIDRGDYRSAVDAIERGKSRKGENDERAKAKAAADAEREKRRREKPNPGRPVRGSKRNYVRATKDSDMDYADALEQLTDLIEAMDAEIEDDASVKAGSRHNAGDRALLQALYAAGCDICDLACRLGAEPTEEMKAQRTFGGKERDELEASDFGDPEGRKFPIMTAADVQDAAALIGKADDPEAVKRRIIAIARRKGFADAIPEAWLSETKKSLEDETLSSVEYSGSVTKGLEWLADDLVVMPGDGVKAIGSGDGWVGGLLVKHGGEGDFSDWRDVFTKDTQFGSHRKTDVWVHHRMLPGLGKRKLTNQAELDFTDEGVFIKHLLDLRSSYERKLYDMVQAGKLGWSSGTAPHLVERKALGDGRHQIDQWPLGLDASYTPMPAGGMGVEARATALKSLFADAGIDLLHAIYADPEATKTDPVEVSPDQGAETKAAHSDRERSLLLEIELLALEA